MQPAKELKLINTLKENEGLRKIVKGLQILHQDPTLKPIDTIRGLNLPLGIHLYVTGNYSDLMQIKIK